MEETVLTEIRSNLSLSLMSDLLSLQWNMTEQKVLPGKQTKKLLYFSQRLLQNINMTI